MAQVDQDANGAFPWHLGVYDAHCHPTDTMASIEEIPKMKARTLTVMATRAQDQQLVIDVAERLGVTASGLAQNEQRDENKEKLVPSFGWHPWFSHQIFDDSASGDAGAFDEEAKVLHYRAVLTPKSEDREFLRSLPDPRPLSAFLNETKEHLLRFPFALVGEVGLDRAFRIPEAWLPEHHEQRDDSLTPGGREGRRLSPYRVHMDHQKKILLAQLRLAGELNRAVSVHGVAAHGVIFEALRETWKGHELKVLSKRQRKRLRDGFDLDEDTESEEADGAQPKPYPPRMCMHSYSGPADTIKQYVDPSIPVDIFFSFSTAINFSSGSSDKGAAAILAVPDDKILIESDLHTAGLRMDQHLEEIVRLVCNLKGWDLEDGVARLGQNWKRFVFGA
ncbi:Metallo-dependent hydrolase [Rhizodiscina lignyota]|uniref:Metallo-dependent hydrolase n=1 Tax=Rhizodiscina lignyota TaxID=1504668 RepID=A0A9P4IGG6_9PEZI|nr:Metallo-dependent hydrolase [Rhizodiscina lignyota]